jgi:hypothetical protein
MTSVIVDRIDELVASGMTPYIKAGCKYQGTQFRLDCLPESALAALGCEQIMPASSLADLTPNYALANCLTTQAPAQTLMTHFEQSGCMQPAFIGHVVYKDGAFALVSTETEFRELFAPVNTAGEALSYAVAITNLHADYENENPLFNHLSVDVKNTQVLETSAGYEINLFTSVTPRCGCGLHTTDMVKLLVTRDGEIQRLQSIPAYQFEACLD